MNKMCQMTDTNTSSSYYDKLASEYRETSLRRLPYLLGVEKVVTDALSTASSPRLLDIGTGDGVRLARILKEVSGVEVIAIEQSSGMYHLATENIPDVTVINDDFTAVNIPQNYFTHITALWNVIGHVRNRSLFLELACNALSIGGLFICVVNNRYNIKTYGVINVLRNFCTDLILGDASGRYFLQYGGSTTNVFLYSEKLLRVDLNQAGFDIEEIIYINYANGTRERLPICGQILCVARKK